MTSFRLKSIITHLEHRSMKLGGIERLSSTLITHTDEMYSNKKLWKL